MRLSTRSISSTPFDDSVPSWSQAFLRQDILWIIHYRPTPDTGKVNTIKLVTRQAWWSGIENDAELIFAHCAICIQARATERAVDTCCAVNAKAEQHLSYLGSTVKRLEVSCSMIAKPRCCETAKGLRLYKNSNQENRNQLGQVSKIKDYPTVPYKRSTMSSTMSIHYRLIRQMLSACAQQGFRG